MKIKLFALYTILLLYPVYSNVNYNMNYNILRNKYLRIYLIHYKKKNEKNVNYFVHDFIHVHHIKDIMLNKFNNIYNSVLSHYYEANSFYYNLSDDEKFLIDNIFALLY